jgi:hypothetical protein
MPALDKTGPEGKGPLTGRGFGNCEGAKTIRAGFSRGFGRGFAQRRNAPSTQSREELKKALEQEKAEIEKKLESL